MLALEGKIALVTGASSGIGRASAKLFADSGAKVIAVARRGAELESLAAEIGPQVATMAGDVCSETDWERIADFAADRFGGLDIAFNNAGMLGEMADVSSLSPQGWRDTLETNLTSAFLGARKQVPLLRQRGGGALVFTATIVGYTVGFPGMAAYAASKAGLIGLVQCLAAELGAEGIRVNALVPGGTDTPMGRIVAATPELRQHIAGLHALKRLAGPEEIARAALFLASEASSFITGSALLADGGISILRG